MKDEELKKDADDTAKEVNAENAENAEETCGANPETEQPDETASEETKEGSEESGSAKEEKKGFFKKKKDPRDEKIEELTDRVKRQMAEFENFRKRTEKEKSGMYEMGAKDIIERMLPVVDN